MTFPDDNKITSRSTLGNGPLEIIEESSESDPLLSKKFHPANDSLSSRALPWYKTPSEYWLLPVFFVVSVTFGLVISPRVKFYVDIVCKDYYSSKLDNNGGQELSDDMCNIPEVQAGVSQLMMVLNLCSAIPGVFVLGPLGALSDRVGRRVVFLFAGVGMVSTNLCILLVGHFWNHLGTNFLLVGYLMDGITGGVLSFISNSYAYATDCTTPTQKSTVFGLMQGTILMGFSLGPMIAGWMVKATNNVLSVFYVASIVFTLFILFILFVLPESIPLEKRLKNQKHHQDKMMNHSSIWEWFKVLNLFTSLSILFRKNPEPGSHNVEELGEDITPSSAGKNSLLILTGITLLLFGVLVGVQQILLLYTSYVFKWSLMEQGYVLFLIGISRAVILLVIYPIFVKLFKKRNKRHSENDRDKYKVINNNDDDRYVTRKTQPSLVTVLDEFDEKEMKRELIFETRMIRFALTVDTISYFVCGLATSSTIFISAYFFGSLGAMSGPMVKSLQTNLVPSSHVGQLLGAICVLESITRIIAPVIFNSMYSLLVATSPHLIWYAFASMTAMGVALTFGITPKDPKRK